VNYDPSKHTITAASANAYYSSNSTQNSLLQTILDFKRAEFVQEGHRWFDIQRYGAAVTHYDIYGNAVTVNAGDNRRVLQIPLSAQTSGLALNPR
jgi:hypothetical protein